MYSIVPPADSMRLVILTIEILHNSRHSMHFFVKFAASFKLLSGMNELLVLIEKIFIIILIRNQYCARFLLFLINLSKHHNTLFTLFEATFN